MANEIRTGIRIDGDASGAKAAFEQVERGAKGVSDQIDSTANSSAQLGGAFKKVLDSLSGWSGSGPLPSATTALNVMSTVVDLLPGKLGLAIAGAVALGSAFYQAHAETERQSDALLLTGNYAGLVGGQLNEMARDAATNTSASVGNMRQIMEALVATGQVSTQSLGEMARSVELVTRFSGRSRDAVISDFASMSNGVAAWAAKHNESYHFITFEQYKHIEALEKAGNAQEAMRVTSEALSQHLGGDLTRNMGTLERSWNSIKNTSSKAWDAMLDVGRDETLQDKISSITAQLNALENRKTSGRYSEAQREELKAGLQAQLEAAQESERLARRAADNRAQREREEADKIAADRNKKKDGGSSDFAANFINRLTTQHANLSGQMSKTDEVTRQLETSTGKFTEAQRREALNLARLIDERVNANKVSQEWTKHLQQQEQAQQAANDAFTANVIGLNNQSREYEFQISLLGKSAEEVQRLTAAHNAKLSLDRMLLDIQRQLDSGAMTEQDAMERETALRIQANKALEDQVRLMDEVELRRRDMLAGATDGLRDYERTAMRVGDSTANAVKSGFKGMEDAAISFAKTSKLEMTALANSVLADLLRIQIQKNITGPLAGSMGGMGGLFNFGTASRYGTNVGSEQTAMLAAQEAGFFHRGGMVGSEPTFQRAVHPAVFRGAPRFHTGGITGDEVPIITKRGEGVFTPGQMKALGAGMGGGNMQVSITVIDNVGTKVTARPKPGGAGNEFELLIDAVDAGLADRAGAGQSRLGQAMAGRFGLREAVN